MAHNNNSGCINTIFALIFILLMLFAIGKGCVSCADELFKSSNNRSYTPSSSYNQSNSGGRQSSACSASRASRWSRAAPRWTS